VNFEIAGFEDLIAHASALEANWSKESRDAEAIAGYGASATISQMDSAINEMNSKFAEFHKHLKARDIASARAALKDAEKSYHDAQSKADNYAMIKKAITGIQIVNVADKVFDPDEGAENIAEMTSLGNVGGAAVKGVYKGLLGLVGIGADAVLSETTDGKISIIDTVDSGVDKVAGTINKMPGVSHLRDGVEATFGKGVQSAMNLKIAPDKTYWKDAQGKLHESYESAKAFNDSKGYGFEPEEMYWDTRVGAIATRATGGMKDAGKEMSKLNPLSGIKSSPDYKWYNPFTYRLWGNLRDSNKEYREQLESAKTREENYKADGFSTSDMTKWTDADWELDRAYNAEFLNSYEEADREIDAKRAAVQHYLDVGSKDIKLKAYFNADRNEKGILKNYPFNTNWYDGGEMGNDFGDLDPIAEGFFDDGGRPTQKLLNYAKATGRKIKLYDGGEWGMKGERGFVDPAVELDPNDESFWHDAGDVMRGIKAPNVREVQEGEMDYLDEMYYFKMEGEDGEKLMMYDLEGDTNYIRNEENGLLYAGDVLMDEDHAHLGSNWYEDDFFGYEYRHKSEDLDGTWLFQTDGESQGWVYEAQNEAGSTWVWSQDMGWMYPYISEETGEKWVWSEEQGDWGHWETNRGRDKSDWLWQNPPEPEQEEQAIAQVQPEPEPLSMEEQRKAFIDDYWYNEKPELKEHIYKMNDKALKTTMQFVTDGATDAEKMHKWTMGLVNSNVNAGPNAAAIAFNMSAAATQSAMARVNAAKMNMGSSMQDVRSNQPNLNMPQQNTGSGDSGTFKLNTQPQGGNMGTGNSGTFQLNTTTPFIPVYNDFTIKTFGYDYSQQSA
jgi:hypothetical protein